MVAERAKWLPNSYSTSHYLMREFAKAICQAFSLRIEVTESRLEEIIREEISLEIGEAGVDTVCNVSRLVKAIKKEIKK